MHKQTSSKRSYQKYEEKNNKYKEHEHNRVVFIVVYALCAHHLSQINRVIFAILIILSSSICVFFLFIFFTKYLPVYRYIVYIIYIYATSKRRLLQIAVELISALASTTQCSHATSTSYTNMHCPVEVESNGLCFFCIFFFGFIASLFFIVL